ncbi:glycosyl hydrolase [Xylaria bambusicola]|uniref:glycosyl hydrolase n=1 Tax=Xylaria bambusicola TaxID=326684 RepID=UPI002008B445|nr:glycosyl hydrolase [Xylaria bambusicola]KAI0508937.1 glycosyl hydrolase [Xylaria bambusicola]
MAGIWKLASVALFAVSITAQNSTYVNPAVPTGTPVAGVYTGSLRPQIHFSPPKGFMNDPNGMFVDANGTWHLYYQLNPTGIVAGNQHWGHATSNDLYHWINQPIALFPPEETVYVFSGSAVVDSNNTSGFFPDQDNGVVAIFTLARYYDDGSAGPQTQNIAYSRDGGYSFEYYDENPVIDSTSSQFRDPKVSWYEDHWVAVIAYSQEFNIGIFTSPDLKDWTFASNFTPHGLLGTQYECPNFVKMPVRDADGAVIDEKYVMAISIQPGAPLGGSITEYFVGDFNGTHFTTSDAVTRLTDFGKDNYAAQYFYGIPDGQNQINMGWASNWQYAQKVPTGNLEGWRSIMTTPRVNYLTEAPRIGLVMIDELYDLTPILDDQLNASIFNGSGTLALDYSSVESGALYLEVNVTNINTTLLTEYSTLNVSFASPASGEILQSGFYFSGDTPFFVNRGGIKGFDNVFFTDKFSTSDVYSTGSGDGLASWSMKAVIDRSIFEVFVDGGIHAGTVLFYPQQPLTALNLAARLHPGARISVNVRSLKSTWAEFENENGTVLGNVTDSRS